MIFNYKYVCSRSAFDLIKLITLLPLTCIYNIITAFSKNFVRSPFSNDFVISIRSFEFVLLV